MLRREYFQQEDVVRRWLELGDGIYPLTIVATRYRGTYEGALWVAFQRQANDIPADYHGSDIECCDFWADLKRTDEIVGYGESPDEAVKDIEERWKERLGGGPYPNPAKVKERLDRIRQLMTP